MHHKCQLSVIVAAFILVSIIAVPASGQTSAAAGLTADRAAREQRFESPIAALSGASADAGVIAYVRSSTHDIHLVSPDRTGDRVLWAAPQPLSI